MRNLLKADFHKFFMGKLFIVLVILMFVFPLISSITYIFVDDSLLPYIGNVNTTFVNSFSILQNFGILVFIFMIIILATDFNHNTIRNKVIMGHSKKNIYLSALVLNLVLSLAFITIYAVLQSFIFGMFFGFDFDGNFLLRYFPPQILIVVSFFMMLQFIVFLIRSSGHSILISFGVIVAVAIIIGLISLVRNQWLIDTLMLWLPTGQISFGAGLDFTDNNVLLQSLIASAIQIGVYVGLGLYLNDKIDYK